MNKKIIASIFIAVMGLLTLSIGLHSALASSYPEVDLSGNDNGYNAVHNWGWPSPNFCECYHDTYQNDFYDTEAGLAVNTQIILHNGNPVFNWGGWYFEDEAGGSSNGNTGYANGIETPMVCTAVTNNQNYCYYNDYATPQWGQPPLANYNCLYVYYPSSGSLNYYTSVEGVTTAQFYQVSNPSNTWWITAYTQDPNNPGNGWTYLTAHS